jgi:uncharacterized protein (TIGR02145 family)
MNKTLPPSLWLTCGLMACMLTWTACDKEKTNSTLPHSFDATPGDPVTDIDGNTYPTVILGRQVWMAANLATTRYANGDPILYVESDIDWNEKVGLLPNDGAWCYYNHEEIHDGLYGKLYNWHAVIDDRNLCPDGWSVASDDDWHTLAKYLDPRSFIDSFAINPLQPNLKMRSRNSIESAVAGGYLKTTGDSTLGSGLWSSPNKGASNTSMFNARPGGARMVHYLVLQGIPVFSGIGKAAAFWTKTSALDLPPEPGAIYRLVGFDVAALEQREASRRSGLSVRCIQNL